MAMTPAQIREWATLQGRFSREEIDDLVGRAAAFEKEAEVYIERLLRTGDSGSRGRQRRSAVAPPTPSPEQRFRSGIFGSEEASVDPTDNDTHSLDMRSAERIARLEASIDGLRHSQNMTIGATVGVGGIIAAFVIGFGIYSLQRIDQTQDAIVREAAQTRQELVGVTTAISNSITAARQIQPQIVVMPAQAPQTPVKP